MVVYLIAAVLLFPAFGGGSHLLKLALRQKTRLGQSIRGRTAAKIIAGAAWFGGFLLIVYFSAFLNSFPFFALGIFIWEGIGLYGAYLWYRLQESWITWKLGLK